MSFFKKNKPKSKKAKPSKAKPQTKLEKEIVKMDRERHLDMQLEELTAQLNMPSETSETADNSLTMSTKNVKKDDFIADSLKGFITPSFTADISSKTKNIDVTSSDSEAPKMLETDIDALLADARKIAEGETKAETLPTLPQSPEMQKNEELPNIETDIALSGPNRLDMGAMRLDVAKISADIQSGEEIYRRALQRVEGLMGFVEKAEVDFSVLNRLEPENRRLKAKLRTAQGEVETIKGKLSLTAADLEDHQARLTEKTTQYEQVRSKLVTAANSLQEYERVLKATKTESERFALTVERHKTALSVEGRENKVLREKVGELSKALETRQAEYLEASKMVESLRSDCADFRDQAETYRSEAQDLRVTLNTAKRQNNAMKGEMQALHEDIKTFKTQYEFNVINREDQVTDLESQVAFLAKEIDAKTEVANSATQSLATLRSIRNEQDIERDRLEKQLSAAQEEIKDVKTLSEKRNSDKLNTLQNDIRQLQAEIARRDEMSEHTAKETDDLQRARTSLELERDQLSSRLEVQTEQLENAIKNNPANELQGKIDKLTEQLRIKDAIVQSAAQDVSTLQKAREAQNLENKRLEDLIHAQTFQLEAAQKALFQSKQTESELDQKYKDIAAALSVNQERRRSESTSASPDITPDISDEFNDLSGDDVEDLIMDYKFGIRKDLV